MASPFESLIGYAVYGFQCSTVKQPQTISNNLKPFETTSNHFKQSQTIRNYFKQIQTTPLLLYLQYFL